MLSNAGEEAVMSQANNAVAGERDAVIAEVAADARAIRASDAERDRVVRKLECEYAAGRLRAPELEERVAAAQGAQTRAQLKALTGDLPGDPDQAQAATPVRDSGLMCLLLCCCPPAWLANWLMSRGALGRGSRVGDEQPLLPIGGLTATVDRE